MRYNKMDKIKEKIIKALIKQKCFVFEGGPFVSSSGFSVPFFIDIRRLFSEPKILNFISDELLKYCRKKEISILAGGETAGIPFASVMSSRGSLPFFYVRKKKQDHGMKSVIAGLSPNKKDKIALIDDSLGGGGSVNLFIENLKKEGYNISLFLYILEMDVFKNSKKRMDELSKKNKFEYFHLVTWEEWILYMYKKGFMSEKLKDICLEVVINPLFFSEKGKIDWYCKEKKEGNIWFKG